MVSLWFTFISLPHVAAIVPIPRFLQHTLRVDVVVLAVLRGGFVLLQILGAVVIRCLGSDPIPQCVCSTYKQKIKSFHFSVQLMRQR